MTHPENTTFHHRHHDNGTLDSICPRCFLTIALAIEKQHVSLVEHIHECDPFRLHQIENGLREQHFPTAA